MRQVIALGKFITARVRGALWRIVKGGLVLCALGLCAAGFFIYHFSKNLPQVQDLFLAYRRPCVRLFDANGTLLATYGDVYGEVVPLEQLPAYVPQALMAVEDKRFYQHFGVDLWGIGRALWVNYRTGRVRQGGSTITQQLAKNLLQAHHLFGIYDRTLRRKIQEAILAVVLETKLSKEQILTLYLNRVYFGAGAFGIDAAAQRYFGKSARHINVYEAALLMGLLKAPSRYAPTHSYARSDGRTRQVLQKMVDYGCLSTEGVEVALRLAEGGPEITTASSVHYFTDWVIDQLRHIISLNQDLDVMTTLDMSLQQMAHKRMQQVVNKQGKAWKANQMALVATTPSGAVKAMVGGVDYLESKFNRVTQAQRQSGSLFKFFTYLAALEKGHQPEDIIEDTPIEVGGWAPSNYLHKAQGTVTLRQGFAQSINAVAVRLAQQVGLPLMKKTAHKLGLTTPIQNDLSVALGSNSVTLLQMTCAFAALVNQGFLVVPYGIKTIKNRRGNVLYQHDIKQQRVIEPQVLVHMLDLMQAVVQQGTGRRARLMHQPTGCKTGTSQNYRDLWYIGFSPQLITGVWTGDDADKPLHYAKGGSPSGHLWQQFMREALANKPRAEFQIPHVPTADTSEASTTHVPWMQLPFADTKHDIYVSHEQSDVKKNTAEGAMETQTRPYSQAWAEQKSTIPSIDALLEEIES